MRYLDRTAINIVLTTAGSIVAVSGIFMLFHYESQFTKVLHDIGVVILVVFAILHVMINR